MSGHFGLARPYPRLAHNIAAMVRQILNIGDKTVISRAFSIPYLLILKAPKLIDQHSELSTHRTWMDMEPGRPSLAGDAALRHPANRVALVSSAVTGNSHAGGVRGLAE